MTDKQLIKYKVLCDDYEEVRRILFEIIETGEEIEGHYQIQKWINNLYVENKQLKSDNNRLVNETANIIAEHQHKVLDLIDNKVEELERRYKCGQLHYACPMHNIRFGINVLKELKKELIE